MSNKPHDNWKTPKEFYDKLNKEFNFDFDPCPLNHDFSWDGLQIEWGQRNFVNPPYSKKLKELFVKKAIEESNKGNLCVLLIPVSTSTKLFHDYILPNAKDVRFVKGRLRFEGLDSKGILLNESPARQDSMIIIFDGRGFQ